MASFLNGAAAMACVAVGTYFARFWQRNRRPSLLVPGGRLLDSSRSTTPRSASFPLEDERGAYAFALRLVGFAAILVGVMLKDRELADHLTSDIRDDAF